MDLYNLSNLLGNTGFEPDPAFSGAAWLSLSPANGNKTQGIWANMGSDGRSDIDEQGSDQGCS